MKDIEVGDMFVIGDDEHISPYRYIITYVDNSNDVVEYFETHRNELGILSFEYMREGCLHFKVKSDIFDPNT